MEIRLLRYFCTIAVEENISRAAEVLHITQPTLSRQLKELEEELGLKLFNREKRRMVLTEAGLFLLDRAKEIIELTDKTEREFLDQKKQLFSGHLAIGCVEADNSDTLALMLEEFISEYPQVTFYIFSGTGDVIREKLDKGLLDIAILLEPISLENYDTVILPRTETWGLMVENRSFLANKPKITPEDMLGVPLITSARREVQEMIGNWLNRPFDDLNIVGKYTLIFNVFALVENQVGSALTIEGTAAYYRSDKLTFIPLEPEIKTRCVLAWKKNRQLSPAVNEFILRFKNAFKA